MAKLKGPDQTLLTAEEISNLVSVPNMRKLDIEDRRGTTVLMNDWDRLFMNMPVDDVTFDSYPYSTPIKGSLRYNKMPQDYKDAEARRLNEQMKAAIGKIKDDFHKNNMRNRRRVKGKTIKNEQD